MPLETLSLRMLTGRDGLRCLPAGRCVCGGAGGGATGRAVVDADVDAGVDVNGGGLR